MWIERHRQGQRVEARTFRSFDGVGLAYYRYYSDSDTGAAVILLHRLLSRASALAEVAECLRRRRLRAVALDLRAHGGSDAPRDPEAYRDQAMAGDIIALGEHLGFAETAMFGYGVGTEIPSGVINLDTPVTRAVMCGWGGPPTDLLHLCGSEEGERRAIRLNTNAACGVAIPAGI